MGVICVYVLDCYFLFFFFFKQKTAYEIYQCDWSSDVCSSDLWKGEVESGEEWRLTLKLPPSRLDALRSRLHELHPYQIPQFVVLDAAASDEYSRWVRDSCS